MKDLSFLLFRVGFGGLMFWLHGLPKWLKFSADPSAFMSLPFISNEATFYMAVFVEGVCALLVVAGVFSRLAAFMLFGAMCVAAFVVSDGQPLEKREMALLFALGFGLIAANGPGAYSLDRMFWKIRS